MPEPENILAGLRGLANAYMWVALSWHAVFVLLTLGILAGWRPTRRNGAALLAWPLASAAIMALAGGNIFNAAMLAWALLGLSTLAATRAGPSPTRTGPRWAVLLGILVALSGLFYPHFLETSWHIVPLAAPVGVLPCPTLLTMIGFTFVFDGFLSRSWSTLLALLGMFYGAFGMLRLSVWFDGVLLLSSLALLAWMLARPLPGQSSSRIRTAVKNSS